MNLALEESSNYGLSGIDEIFGENDDKSNINTKDMMDIVKNNSVSKSQNSEVHNKYKVNKLRSIRNAKNFISFRDTKLKAQSTPSNHDFNYSRKIGLALVVNRKQINEEEKKLLVTSQRKLCFSLLR